MRLFDDKYHIVHVLPLLGYRMQYNQLIMHRQYENRMHIHYDSKLRARVQSLIMTRSSHP